MHRLLLPVSAWSSSFIAAIVGFGGTVALVVQAMQGLGASVAQISSAVTALCLGIAVTGAALSIRCRMPIVLAWSTPGAALLAAAPLATTWPAALGAFLCAGALMTALGAVPALGRLAQRIPSFTASGMLAGVLLPFCLALFRAGSADPLLVSLAVLVFLAARIRLPLYALLMVLVTGTALVVVRGQIEALPPGATFGVLAPVVPEFAWQPVASIGLPLFLVTLASQNLPGLAVLRSFGYEPEPSRLLKGTGIATMIGAPFGAHAVNLSAITAALCMSPEALPARSRRWLVACIYAGWYLALALFAPLLVRFFLALPPAALASLTGVALIPALTGAVEAALADREERDAAMVTFLAAGSGITVAGLGGAFWGLTAGLCALALKWLLGRKPMSPG